MKQKMNLTGFISAICILLFPANASGQEPYPCATGGHTCYFAIEINSVLCGYSIDKYCNAVNGGKNIRYENSDVFLKMRALGSEMNGGFKFRSVINLGTGRAEKLNVDVINGESVAQFNTRVSGDTAFFTSPTSGVSKVIPLASGVILSSSSWYPHLIDDFIKNGSDERRYRVYDPVKGEIVDKGYVRKPDEKIALRDSSFNTLVVEETDYSTGLKSTLWINKTNGFNVRTSVAGRNIYLTDRSVTSKVTFADLDKELFYSVGKIIPDFVNLSRIKVRVQINSYGDRLNSESLNGPGQKFTGTVNGSLIDGIFETEMKKYSGENSPPFPPDFSKSLQLKKYLSNEVMIESDEPEIINMARKITAGSKDTWEAAVRLSRWVAGNISGVLPGGISAVNTLKTRGAECGGHSRLLAAFCRAVGIPSRVVVGCMFTNYYSGGFGQHAWTEIYMGENGWIPVDATINESDYIDGGHIRLGENTTFRPVSMEILDFKVSSYTDKDAVPDDIRKIMGCYMNVEHYRMFKIISRSGGLAIDIPGRMVLDLNPPDDKGRWYPILTREISLEPVQSPNGTVEKILLYQNFRLRKMSSPDSLLNDTPEEYRDLAGNYQFQPAHLSLDVSFNKGILTTNDPMGKSAGIINYTKYGDTWSDKTGAYEVGFINENNKQEVFMTLVVSLDFLKGEPVTNPVEEVMNVSDVDAGLRKYDEIKKTGDRYYFFSEQMLHQLGHKLSKENRKEDAIKIFAKNVAEYPDSFLTNDALAEEYLKNGQQEQALEYFKKAVKLNQGYEYGKTMIENLTNK